MSHKLLGRLGTWLCDRYFPRPATKAEIGQSTQYAQLMVDVLNGNVPYYGRDREKDWQPVISERRDYEKIYGREWKR